MHTMGILLVFLSICIGASVIIAVLLHFWPRYGSVNTAVERSDRFLEQMDAAQEQH